MNQDERSYEDQYAGLEIPDFLKRDPNETREQFREAWAKYDAAKPRKETPIMSASLDDLIKSGKLASSLSLNDMRDRYNEACDRLGTPDAKVSTFEDTGKALRKLHGVLATLRAPEPKPDPKLKPVEAKPPKAEKPAKADNPPKQKEEADMATKKAEKAPKSPKAAKADKKPKGEAKATKATKPAKEPVKAPTHVGNVAYGTIREAFEAREGSNRDKLLSALAEKQGKQVPIGDVLKAVYGNKSEEGKTKLMMVVKGLVTTIEASKLPFAIHKAKEEGETSLGLYRTKK